MDRSDFTSEKEWLAYLNTHILDNPVREEQRKKDKVYYNLQVADAALTCVASAGPSDSISTGVFDRNLQQQAPQKLPEIVTVHFPAAPAKDVEIALIDYEHVRITVSGTSRDYHYAELGLEDKRCQEDTYPLNTLILLATKGSLDWDTLKEAGSLNVCKLPKAKIQDIQKHYFLSEGLKSDIKKLNKEFRKVTGCADTLFSYSGKSGARPLCRISNKLQLDNDGGKRTRAVEMEKQGASMYDIVLGTGWCQYNGEWQKATREEIEQLRENPQHEGVEEEFADNRNSECDLDDPCKSSY